MHLSSSVWHVEDPGFNAQQSGPGSQETKDARQRKKAKAKAGFCVWLHFLHFPKAQPQVDFQAWFLTLTFGSFSYLLCTHLFKSGYLRKLMPDAIPFSFLLCLVVVVVVYVCTCAHTCMCLCMEIVEINASLGLCSSGPLPCLLR